MSRSKSEEKKARILQAAETLFTGKRFHEVTLDEVASEAKVSKGTLYLYFKDKDDLFFHTATAGFDDLCRILKEEIPAEGALSARLTLAAGKVSAFFKARRPLLRMIMVEDLRMPWGRAPLKERWFKRRRELRSALAAILDSGSADERLRGDMRSETLAAVFMGMLRSRNQDLSDSPEPELELGILVDLFLHGASRTRAAESSGAAPGRPKRETKAPAGRNR